MQDDRVGVKRFPISAAFLSAEAVLFGYILYTTFLAGGGDAARFLSIIVCALYALLSVLLFEHARNRLFFSGSDGIFLLFAFLFSCIADYFLIFRPEKALPAVILFGIAQIFHALRIASFRTRFPKTGLCLRIGLLTAGFLAAALLKVRDPLIYAGIFYFLNLVVSFGESTVQAFCDRRFLLPLGLFLFILCDVTVGIGGMGRDWGFPPEWIRTAADLTYVFYVPSQVLIALGSIPLRKESN